MAGTRSSARGEVLRSAALFTPFLIVSAFAFSFILRDALSEGWTAGGVVGLALVGLVTVLLAYQVVQSVRDLFAQPVETVGLVERRWSRNDLLLFRNSYIFVQRDVFRLRPEEFIEVDLGDTVRVLHFPHTSTVEAIEVVARAGQENRARHG